MRKYRLILIFGLWIFTGWAFAQTASTSAGQPLDSNSQSTFNGISAFFNFANPMTGINYVLTQFANLFFYGLIWIYGLIGTFLIPIPDLSQIATYQNGSYAIMSNIYGIFACIGAYCCLCGMVINVGIMATGLGRGTVEIKVLFRTLGSVILIWAWPMIFSLGANFCTSAGYLIFGQNSVTSAGIFNGLQVMGTQDITANTSSVMASPGTGINTVPNTSQTLHQSFQYFWSIIYPGALVCCLIGIMYGGWRLSKADQHALQIIFGALLGLVLVLASQTIFKNFIVAGTVLTNSNQINGLANIGQGQLNLPSNVYGGGTSNPQGTISTLSAVTLTAVSALLKIIICLWGLTICVGVIFAKFMQIGTLLIVYCLGPVFCGLISHPSTQGIAFKGFSMLLKNLFSSIIWSLALVILYLLTNINYGAQTVGTNNLMLALAVLAGLELIKNSERFADLFASGFTAGNGHQTWGSFYQGASGMVAGAAGGLSTMTGLAAQAMGVGGVAAGGAKAAAGVMAGGSPHVQLAAAALGAFTPFMGMQTGQQFGQAGNNLYQTVSSLAQGGSGSGGNDTKPSGGNDAMYGGGNLDQTNRLLRRMADGQSSGAAQNQPQQPFDPGQKT